MRDALGDRMKEYEGASRSSLIRRLPVIIRVDGRSFSRYTSRMTTYDAGMHKCMRETALALMEEINGASLAYTQSDEISILVTDWSKYETQPWFGYSLQKVVSSAAALATASFNKAKDETIFGRSPSSFAGNTLPPALFDARAFNLPIHEVENYFLWRQKDAIRNSIQTLGRKVLGPKRLHGLSCEKIKIALMEEGNDWDDLLDWQKRGICVEPIEGLRGHRINNNIPLFSDKDYIPSFVKPLFWKEHEGQ